MFTYPSLRSRIIVTSLYALAVTGLTYALFPDYFTAQPKFLLLGGLWFLLAGYMVALVGVVTWVPMIKRPLRWYWRGPVVSALIYCPIVFWAPNVLEDMLASHVLTTGWPKGILVVIGYLIGMGMDVLATYFGGEGPAALLADSYRTDKK